MDVSPRWPSVRVSAAAGAVLALAVRAPWFDSPLGRDEEQRPPLAVSVPLEPDDGLDPERRARAPRAAGLARRPTWIVQAQPTTAFGLDRSGATARLLARDYRRVARPCGQPVLLARNAGARPHPGLKERCATLPADAVDLDF